MMPPPLDSLHTTDSPSESNPWSDSAPTPPSGPQPLLAPSPDALEGIASEGINVDDDRTQELEPRVHTDILDTFDPLAHHEEQSAREAWAKAEGHPPPPAPPQRDPQAPPQESGPALSSSFPSFSSLARSLVLPSLPNMNISLVAGTRSRPQSMETAHILHTPIHPGTFASQQDAETSVRGSPKTDAAVISPESVQNVLRRDNPSRERPGGGKDKEPSFDFQKFLDQMRTKSAEPVARYLRSCVPPHLFANTALPR